MRVRLGCFSFFPWSVAVTLTQGHRRLLLFYSRGMVSTVGCARLVETSSPKPAPSSSPGNSSPASVISQPRSPQPVPLIVTTETEIQGTRDGSLGFRPWWVCREAEQHRAFLCLFPRGGRLPVSVNEKLASPKVMWVNVAPQTLAFLS